MRGAPNGRTVRVPDRVQDNGIVKATSPRGDPVTHANHRIKGRFGHQHVQNRG
jgi:hypothetical protein